MENIMNEMRKLMEAVNSLPEETHKSTVPMEMVEEAYEDGWNDGRRTTVVDGNFWHDWIESYTKKILDNF